MDLYSPVCMSTLEESRTEALEVLNEPQSEPDDKAEAHQTLTELAEIASSIGLLYRFDAFTDDVQSVMEDIDMEDAEHCCFYDREDLESELRNNGSVELPEHLASYFDWDEYTSDHISECAEFTHNGQTYYAT